jgi:phage baseplate assembly protein gpV
VRLELNDGKAITMDEAGITIDAENGNRIVIDSASGATTIDAASSLRIRAPQIAIEASGSLDIRAAGTLTLRGALVLIN